MNTPSTRITVAAFVALGLARCGASGLAPSPMHDAGPMDASSPVPTSSPLVQARPYTLYAPPSATAPSPLVMMLHGYSATGANEESAYFHLTPTSTADGFLYAHPDGTPDCNGMLSWNATDACCRFCAPAVDDVAYLTAVLDDIASKDASDPKRIFVIGHSNGGFMAHRLACDRASRVAAIVSYAGAQWADPDKCQPTEPVSVVEIHGDQDTGANYTIAYDGGSTTTAAYPSAHQTVATWAAKDGCTGVLTDTGQRLDLIQAVGGDETKVEAYTGCPAGIDVELWTVQGGGHMDALTAPNFGDAVWAFMRAHAKR